MELGAQAVMWLGAGVSLVVLLSKRRRRHYVP
jgi:hypothetical protein